MTFGCKDIAIIKSEFVTKTEFLLIGDTNIFSNSLISDLQFSSKSIIFNRSNVFYKSKVVISRFDYLSNGSPPSQNGINGSGNGIPSQLNGISPSENGLSSSNGIPPMAFTSHQGLKHGLGRMYPQPPLDKGILVNGTGGSKGIQSLFFPLRKSIFINFLTSHFHKWHFMEGQFKRNDV